MPRFVALLRGVNVGKAKRVPMADFRALLAEPSIDASRLLVAFAPDAQALAGLAALRSLVRPPEQVSIGAHAAYLHCPGGLLESRAGEALLGRLGQSVTTRNWATTLKLHALASPRARRSEPVIQALLQR